MKLNTIYNEDYLEGTKRIPDKNVDVILCDLPYGTTACRLDKELQNNLYAFEDTIFNSQQVVAMGLDVEWDYVYIEPDVYPLGSNRQLIVNQEESQAEIAENTNGLLVSVGVTTEESMIKALVDIALHMRADIDEN